MSLQSRQRNQGSPPSDDHPEEVKRQAVLRKLSSFLTIGATGATFRYSGSLLPFTLDEQGLPVRKSQRTSLLDLPDLRRYCRQCRVETNWQPSDELPGAGKLRDILFTCRNCDQSDTVLWLKWSEEDSGGEVTLAGEYPQPEVRIPAELNLAEENQQRYSRALICRRHGFGLAALAYLRRVVEGEIDALLRLVIEAAELAGIDRPAIQHVERALNGGTFEQKASAAGSALPVDLKPGGHNPFSLLVTVPSLGLHNENEEQCVEFFDEIRDVFEYLFRNLRFRNAEAAAYAKRLGDTTRKIGGR